VNETLKNPLFDRVIPVFSDKTYIILPAIVTVILLLCFGNRNSRTCVLALAIALMFSDFGTERVLKNAFRRLRPYAQLETVNVHRSGRWMTYDRRWYAFDERQSFAFPSAHAANIAGAAVILCHLSRRTLWLSVPIALAVGFSRVYTGNHFPLDVVCGYFWGAGSAIFSVRVARWMVRRLWGESPVLGSPPPDSAESVEGPAPF